MAAMSPPRNESELYAADLERERENDRIRTQWIARVQVMLVQGGFTDEMALGFARARFVAMERIINPRMAAADLLKSLHKAAVE